MATTQLQFSFGPEWMARLQAVKEKIGLSDGEVRKQSIDGFAKRLVVERLEQLEKTYGL